MIKKISNKSVISNEPLPLVPAILLVPLWLISLVLPNLIYSGLNFADTLHILKWTVTGVPVAIAVFIAGIRIFIYGSDRIKIKIDIFAAIWGIILIYCVLQPLWVKISSPTGYALEMVCFATVWAYYIISVSSFPQWGLRIILALASINALINTIFAELQLRYMNNLDFLKGTMFEFLIKYSAIILPTPPHYIGNTAQQNMFGLWLAVTTLGIVYLFVFDDKRTNKFYRGFLLLFSGLNYWGLVNSTSRSANLAFFIAIILMFIFTIWKFDKSHLIRFIKVALVLAFVFWIALYSPRLNYTIEKIEEVVEHYETIGKRRGIWTTSYAMAIEHPKGVGIGQYKWHYIEAQREAFKTITADWYEWQYTHWAHNEFLQFFCEGGVIGGILFLIMYSFWFFPGSIGFFRKKAINSECVWGFCLASLITFCALFTRPFHRIENMVWIALAIAFCNREFFPLLKFNASFEVLKSSFSRRIIALVCIVSSIAGICYISSGIYGNYILRQALSTQNATLQYYLLTEANKHPIVREEVQRNLGYHYLNLGEQQDNKELLSKGFNILWEHFNREPHSEDISKLLNFAQRYQLEDVLREIVSYFKPGTYHLERRMQKDSAGRYINALLLMNGSGKDE